MIWHIYNYCTELCIAAGFEGRYYTCQYLNWHMFWPEHFGTYQNGLSFFFFLFERHPWWRVVASVRKGTWSCVSPTWYDSLCRTYYCYSCKKIWTNLNSTIANFTGRKEYKIVLCVEFNIWRWCKYICTEKLYHISILVGIVNMLKQTL